MRDQTQEKKRDAKKENYYVRNARKKENACLCKKVNICKKEMKKRNTRAEKNEIQA